MVTCPDCGKEVTDANADLIKGFESRFVEYEKSLGLLFDRVKADNVIREATIKKNDIISSAYNEIEGTEEVLNKLRREVSDFKRNILSLYKTHIESLSNLPEENTEVQPVEQVVEEVVQETVLVEETVQPEDKFRSVSSLFSEE